MTKKELHKRTRKELADLAREKGVSGWHRMRKNELIDALSSSRAKPKAKSSKAAKKPDGAQVHKAAAHNNTNGNHHSFEEKIESSKFDIGTPTKNLSNTVPKDLPVNYGKDRIVLMVRDPYWLHSYWNITPTSLHRAQATMGQEWHGSKPILRILDVSSSDTTNTTESVVRDIDIHGGCNNWYIEVNDPPRSYRVDIGYLSKSGQFVVLARSNVVTTPRAGMSDVIDENWADIDSRMAERIYAMSSGFDPSASSLELKQLFEERLQRPLGSESITSFGSGAMGGLRQRRFWFQLDAELIVYGATEPGARVSLQGKPVTLRQDGTFTMRFSLPDSRQIIPAVANSADGIEERTVVLAVERNTKHLEPLVHETIGD